MKCIRPKNWHDFQHYKNRAPIWIKLHRKLLDDFEFHGLPVASKALAPMLWLLASEYDEGDIPADMRKIAFRLRMTLEELAAAFQPLLRACFFEIIGEDGEDASRPLAELEPNAIPEKRTSNKREKETETEKKRARVPRAIVEPVPDWVPRVAWESFVEMRRNLRAPLTGHGARLAIAGLLKLRDCGHDPTAVLEQSIMNSWRGLFPINSPKNGHKINGNGHGKPERGVSAFIEGCARAADYEMGEPDDHEAGTGGIAGEVISPLSEKPNGRRG